MALVHKHMDLEFSLENHDIVVAWCGPEKNLRYYRVITQSKELNCLNYSYSQLALYYWDENRQMDCFWDVGKNFNWRELKGEFIEVVKVYRKSHIEPYKSKKEMRMRCSELAMTQDIGDDYNLVWRKK